MLNKKITKLLVGTNNAGKLREIRDLLPKNLKIYSPRDLKIKSPVESGKTFVENEIICTWKYIKILTLLGMFSLKRISSVFSET